MEFRKYIQGDLEKIWRKDLIEELGFTSAYIIDPELTWTGINGDQLIGIAGFRKFWNNVYECWLAAESIEACYKHKIQIIKFIRYQIANLNYHRIQATVLSTNCIDRRFIEYLGFRREAILTKYGPDESDYYLYSLVK